MGFVWASRETDRGAGLEALRARLRDAEGRAALPTGADGAVPWGLAAIDAALPDGGLRAGAAHEFCAGGAGGAGASGGEAPLALLTLVAARASSLRADALTTAWIGPRVFPSVWALAGGGHILVDARRGADCLWAADLALRSRATACVVVDGSSFDAAATRRLQLAAESTGALCLLARPAGDLAELSTAATRWLIEPAPSPHHSCARWTVRLLRCKGLRPTTHLNAWTVDIPHAPRDGRVSSLLRDGPAGPVAATLDGVRAEGRSARRVRCSG